MINNNAFRFDLEKRVKKSICPQCGKKSFVLYIDLATGERVGEKYGRCDRETKCGYHLNPYKEGVKPEEIQGWEPEPPRPPSFIPENILTGTMGRQRMNRNNFLLNLVRNVPFPFDPTDVKKAVELYRLGTVVNGYYSGALTIPFIDVQNNIRAIQVKNFDRANKTTRTTFLTWLLEKHYERKREPLPEWLEEYNKNDLKVSCLFGEHLLSQYPSNPVALVEAPKTAIYGTLYYGFPDVPGNFIWIAVFNASCFDLKRLRVLEGRKVVVFPDLSQDGKTFRKWHKRAEEIAPAIPGVKFSFYRKLEETATNEEKFKALDLADFLIKFNWKAFRNRPRGICKRVTEELEL